MRRSFKYRAYVNKTTEANANHWLDICRNLYNRALEHRINYYQSYKAIQNGIYEHRRTAKYCTCFDLFPVLPPEFISRCKKSISHYDQRVLTTPKKNHPELWPVNSQCIDEVLERLDKAYKAFFRRVKEGKEKPGFPRFANYDRYKSFRVSQSGWKLTGHNLYITNVGRFKLKLHRPIEGRIKTVTISREAGNKWYASFSCDDVPIKPLPKTNNAVGIDVGLLSFVTDSNGEKFPPPKHYIHAERELRVKQRALARCKRGSNRRKKAKLQVSKLHEKVKNQRKDFLRNLAIKYIRENDLVAVEGLNLKGMIQNKYLSKSISDAAWSDFLMQLEYKAEETQRKLVKVDPKYTSQICSDCGHIPEEKIGLSVRVYRCKKCGLILDRDVNAAKNILGRAAPSGAKGL